MIPILKKGTDLKVTLVLIVDAERVDLTADLSNLRIHLVDSEGTVQMRYALNELPAHLDVTAANQETDKGEFSFIIDSDLSAEFAEGNLTAKIYYDKENVAFEDGTETQEQEETIAIVRA